MKKFIISNLVEPTAWAGLVLCVCAFVMPRWFLFLLGVLIIAMDENAAKAWCAKRAPGITAKLNEWMQ